jgi:hypothetical protein
LLFQKEFDQRTDHAFWTLRNNRPAAFRCFKKVGQENSFWGISKVDLKQQVFYCATKVVFTRADNWRQKSISLKKINERWHSRQLRRHRY